MLIVDLECFEIVESHEENYEIVAGTTHHVLFLNLVGDRLSLKLNETELVRTKLSKSPRFHYSFSEIPGLDITLRGTYDRSGLGVASTVITGRFHNGYFVSSSVSQGGFGAER